MAHKNQPGCERSGVYFRNLGHEADGQGGTRPHKFRLGRDRSQAMIRYLQLERVWDGVERRWQRIGRLREVTGGTVVDHDGAAVGVDSRWVGTDRPLWDGLTMQIALAVARGESVVRLVPPPHCQMDAEQLAAWDMFPGPQVPPAEATPADAAAWLRHLQGDFPDIGLEIADAALHEEGGRQLAERTASRVGRLRQELAEAERLPASGRTLHQALDAYCEHVKRTRLAPGGQGNLSQNGVTILTYVKLLKQRHDDIHLDGFGVTEIEAMLTFWRNRPMSKKGKPIAVDTAKDMIKRVRSFVKWLNKERSFRWSKPAGLEWEAVRVERTHEEKSARLSAAQVDTYTIEELVTLYEYANPWERLLTLLALNCGFGQAEVVTLLTSEIRLRRRHDHYRREGSFIKRLRNKTDVYGEWSLWDATVAGVEWQLARRGRTEQQALLLTETGRPLSTPTKGNNRNSKIPRAWVRLLERIRKDKPEFRALSFNKLRKTAGDLVKRFSDGETAAVFLTHGQPVKTDGLLDLYTNRHFDKVFAVLDRVAEYLAPMFAAKPVPFPAADAPEERPALSKGTIKRIQALRAEGYKLRKIGELLGIPAETARRYCRGLPAGKKDNPET